LTDSSHVLRQHEVSSLCALLLEADEDCRYPFDEGEQCSVTISRFCVYMVLLF
jgi:hypothetical protein